MPSVVNSCGAEGLDENVKTMLRLDAKPLEKLLHAGRSLFENVSWMLRGSNTSFAPLGDMPATHEAATDQDASFGGGLTLAGPPRLSLRRLGARSSSGRTPASPTREQPHSETSSSLPTHGASLISRSEASERCEQPHRSSASRLGMRCTSPGACPSAALGVLANESRFRRRCATWAALRHD